MSPGSTALALAQEQIWQRYTGSSLVETAKSLGRRKITPGLNCLVPCQLRQLQKKHSSAKVGGRLRLCLELGTSRRGASKEEERVLQPLAGELMTPNQVSIDPVVVAEILLSTVGAIAAVVGAIAAMKFSPRAVGIPAATEQEIETFLASRLSMNVSAQDKASDPLNLRFTLSDPNVALLRIEIANQLDKGAGAAQCVVASPGIFVASVEPKVAQRWYNANPYWDGETKLLPIRVFYLAKGLAACRTVWVTMSPLTMPSSELPNEGDLAWSIEGPWSRAVPELERVPMHQ